MATLGEIREAIKAIVEPEAVGLKVYPLIPGTAQGKALVVEPAPGAASFDRAMGRGVDEWHFNLILIMSSSSLVVAQTHLDEYIDGGGEKSIRRIVFASNNLGLPNTNAHVSGVVGYGPLEAAAYEHVSATLRLVVITKPS
jgi:hypothetical protein